MDRFSNIRDLEWNNDEKTRATGFTDIEGIGTNLPYTFDASEFPDIITAALEGEYGEVGPYVPPAPPPPPSQVSARQFKLQLLESGLLEAVETWINSQGPEIKIAYDNSGTFLRTEPMMQLGFTELGFTTEQIDDFFTQASTK